MSIPDISTIHISDEVLGASIGAFLGTLGAFSIGLIVERRAAKNVREERNFNKARESLQNLALAEVSCQEISILLVDGIKLLKKIPESLESVKWMITLPRRLNPSEVSILGLRNNELINEWTYLKFKLDLTNHLLDEFINYYSRLSVIYEEKAINGKLSPGDVVELHQATVKRYCSELQDQMIKSLNNVAETYALVLSHAEARGAEVFDVMSPKDLQTFTVKPAHKAKNLKLMKDTIEKMLSDPSSTPDR